jgi:hypothetical protein
MNKKQYLSLLLATIISGLTGGAGFNWLFSEQKISAQNSSPEVVSAQEFRLVDKDGNLRAILSENPTVAGGTTPSLVLYDQNKKARLAVGSFKTNVPTIQLFDENEMSAILLNRADDRSNLILTQSSLKQTGNSIERKSFAALWLTQTPKDGANIGIINEDLKLVWSARKFKLPWESIK